MDGTLYHIELRALVGLLNVVLPEMRISMEVQKAEIVKSYSGPVTSGFLWFKKEREATEEDINKRVRSSSTQMSDDFDRRWYDVWYIQKHITELEELLAGCSTEGVHEVSLSEEHMNIIRRYCRFNS